MSTPPVLIEDLDGDFDTYLWNTEDNMARRAANPRVDAIYSTDSDETFLVGIEEAEVIEVAGTATGFRISQQSEYSDDPLTALGEWGARLLSMVNGLQGEGWNFVNDFTDRSMPGVIESVDLIRRRTEKYEVQWSVTFRVGEGMMPYKAPDPPDVDPTVGASLDGTDLHEIGEMRISKYQKLETHKFALHPVEENGVRAKTGARKDISIQGSVPGDESVRSSFDQSIRDNAGADAIVEFDSPFPGRPIDVMVSEFESSREAGVTRIGDYSLEIIEGVTST